MVLSMIPIVRARRPKSITAILPVKRCKALFSSNPPSNSKTTTVFLKKKKICVTFFLPWTKKKKKRERTFCYKSFEEMRVALLEHLPLIAIWLGFKKIRSALLITLTLRVLVIVSMLLWLNKAIQVSLR